MMSCRSRPMASRSASRSSRLVIRVLRSPSCLALTACVSGDWKCTSGTVARSRCGATSCAARGTPTCEWMSRVRLPGLVSRPGRSCARAEVASYLFQTFVIGRSLVRGGFLKDAEVLRDRGFVGLERGGRALEGHGASVDDDDVVGELERELDVL